MLVELLRIIRWVRIKQSFGEIKFYFQTKSKYSHRSYLVKIIWELDLIVLASFITIFAEMTLSLWNFRENRVRTFHSLSALQKIGRIWWGYIREIDIWKSSRPWRFSSLVVKVRKLKSWTYFEYIGGSEYEMEVL
jgi:hypothetical protein